MTTDRLTEYRTITSVLWTDESIASHLQQFEDAAKFVASGHRYEIRTDMGSCQCGATEGHMFMRYDVPWVETRGSEWWQNYDGPAAECPVPYGLGLGVRMIASLILGTPFPPKIHFADCWPITAAALT